MAPRISAAIPLYNKSAYIEDTVRSALSQSFSDLEIIVVDDGSTDDGAAKLCRLGDSRLRIVQQANAGPAAARNRAMAEAKAPFVAFLDADDLWLPDHVLHLAALSERFPTAALFGNRFLQVPPRRAGSGLLRDSSVGPSEADSETRHACGNTSPTAAMKTAKNAPADPDIKYRLLDDYFEECVFFAEPFFTSSCMVRRDRALEVGGFPVGNFCGEDLALWIKLAAADYVAISNYLGCCYRRQPDSLSFQPFYRNANDISMAVLEDLLAQNPGWPPARRHSIREFYFRIALAHCFDCLIAGETSQAKRFLNMSARTQALRSRWHKAKLLALTPKPIRNLLLSLRPN
jgi:glycosyltransferase involved in cell wall biosynthesis